MILGVIQARMNSSRFPGKVLKPLFGTPMLLIMADRAAQAARMDKLVVATSIERTDDPIEAICGRNGIECFRGNLDDVLDRFHEAAKIWKPDHIVRLTGDCPMIDPGIIDRTIERHLEDHNDYTRNVGFPDGLDVEVMTYAALDRAWREAGSSFEREHVTPHLYMSNGKFKTGSYKNNSDLSHFKLSIDTEEDYLRLSKILEILICENSTLRFLRIY